MPTNFLLKDFPDVSDTHFTDLGTVTVICGKNNSGKTRLLTALATTNQKNKKVLEYVVPAVSRDSNFLNNVLDGIELLGTEHGLSECSSLQRDEIYELLSFALSSKETWRKDEIPEITSRIEQRVGKEAVWRQSLVKVAENALKNAMPEILIPDYMVYIPPKRAKCSYIISFN